MSQSMIFLYSSVIQIWYLRNNCRTRWIIVHTLHSNKKLVTVSIYYYEIQYLLINPLRVIADIQIIITIKRLSDRLLINKVWTPDVVLVLVVQLFIIISRTEWSWIKGLSETRYKLSCSLTVFLHSVIQTSQILVTPARKTI